MTCLLLNKQITGGVVQGTGDSSRLEDSDWIWITWLEGTQMTQKDIILLSSFVFHVFRGFQGLFAFFVADIML